MILLALTAMMPWVLSGCNTTGCSDNHSALPLMGFYASPSGEELTLDSLDIGGVGAPDDSLLIRSGNSVRQVYLPFRFEQDKTSFFIHYDYPEQGLDDPAMNDTITFRYTSEPFFASEECGAMYRYTVRQVEYTTHLIDSVAVTDSVVTNIERERFQVFIRTTEPPEPEAEETRRLSLKPGRGGNL